MGAGRGTGFFSWKGGIGTSSRVSPEQLGGYTLGVLVQTNYGGVLQMGGAPVDKALGKYQMKEYVESEYPDGSIMMIVATDAPLSDRNLTRLGRRALTGLARTGSSMSNGSGDYVISFSTAESVRRTVERLSEASTITDLPNNRVSPLFQAAIEATEEAIYNAALMAPLWRAITPPPGNRSLWKRFPSMPSGKSINGIAEMPTTEFVIQLHQAWSCGIVQTGDRLR